MIHKEILKRSFKKYLNDFKVFTPQEIFKLFISEKDGDLEIVNNLRN